MAFHAGVLRKLAEQGNMENVTHISTVSGGSLITGLIFKLANYQWPDSQTYLESVHPKIRQLLTTECLQSQAFKTLLFIPSNWKYAMSRAQVLAQTIESLWKIDSLMSDLPEFPVWSINGTTAETGRRLRFKGTEVGDYELGYADVGNFSLSKAMAVSAAFPGGIGPLSFPCKKYTWLEYKTGVQVLPKFKQLHLYDGGIYDNLGIEPLFDMGKQCIKPQVTEDIDILLVSDAGAPLLRSDIPGPMRPSRFKRIADIALDQTRALRIRSFVNFLINNPDAGQYYQIGVCATKKIHQYAKISPNIATQLLKQDWLSGDQTTSAAYYPTTLKKLSVDKFDLLDRHGYETVSWNNELFRDQLK